MNPKENILILTLILVISSQAMTSKFGGYEIPTGNISKSCNRYSFKTILFDDQEIEQGHKEISNLLPYGRTNIRKFLETKDQKYLIEAGKEVSFIAIPAVLALLIGICCIPGFICFFFCRCCFGCLGLRETTGKRNRRKRRKNRQRKRDNKILDKDEELTHNLTEGS